MNQKDFNEQFVSSEFVTLSASDTESNYRHLSVMKWLVVGVIVSLFFHGALLVYLGDVYEEFNQIGSEETNTFEVVLKQEIASAITEVLDEDAVKESKEIIEEKVQEKDEQLAEVVREEESKEKNQFEQTEETAEIHNPFHSDLPGQSGIDDSELPEAVSLDQDIPLASLPDKVELKVPSNEIKPEDLGIESLGPITSEDVVETNISESTAYEIKEETTQIIETADSKQADFQKDFIVTVDKLSDKTSDVEVIEVLSLKEKSFPTNKTIEKEAVADLIGNDLKSGSDGSLNTEIPKEFLKKFGKFEVLDDDSLELAKVNEPFSEFEAQRLRVRNRYLKKFYEQILEHFHIGNEYKQLVNGTIKFEIDSDGYLVDAYVFEASGDINVDLLALDAVRSVSKYSVPASKEITARYYRYLNFHYTNSLDLMKEKPFITQQE